MIIERKKMKSFLSGKGGYIKLEKLAIPETMKITLLGKTILPESFDEYGQPFFSEEQWLYYTLKDKEMKNNNRRESASLELEIEYEERIFDVPRSSFDTIKGIKKALLSLSTLNELLENRKLFVCTHKDKRLNEFILFGYFLLDTRGGYVYHVVNRMKRDLIFKEDVETYAKFRKNNFDYFTLSGGADGFVIPTTDSVCPCCKKVFTIEDVKNNPCRFDGDGNFCHVSCLEKAENIL